jgi:hypothetical protein
MALGLVVALMLDSSAGTLPHHSFSRLPPKSTLTLFQHEAMAGRPYWSGQRMIGRVPTSLRSITLRFADFKSRSYPRGFLSTGIPPTLLFFALTDPFRLHGAMNDLTFATTGWLVLVTLTLGLFAMLVAASLIRSILNRGQASNIPQKAFGIIALALTITVLIGALTLLAIMLDGYGNLRTELGALSVFIMTLGITKNIEYTYTAAKESYLKSFNDKTIVVETNPSPHWIQNVWDLILRPKAIERNGRLYERMGIPFIQRLIIRLGKKRGLLHYRMVRRPLNYVALARQSERLHILGTLLSLEAFAFLELPDIPVLTTLAGGYFIVRVLLVFTHRYVRLRILAVISEKDRRAQRRTLEDLSLRAA